MLAINGTPLPLDKGIGFQLPHADFAGLADDLAAIVKEIPIERAGATGDLVDWIKANFRLDDLTSLLPPKTWPGPRQGAVMDMPQWPAEPSFRLNTLYWPSYGATRYAWFHCFVTDDWLTNFGTPPDEEDEGGEDEEGGGEEDEEDDSVTDPVTLSMDDGNNGTVEFSMYMLPPKPVTIPGNQLYLLTLVDYRYFFRYQSTGDVPVARYPEDSDDEEGDDDTEEESLLPSEPEVDEESTDDEDDETTTWDELIDQVTENMGIEVEYEEIDELFGNPHPSLTSRFVNGALLLDNIAANICRRFVSDFDGTYSLLSVDDSESIFNENYEEFPDSTRAGGFANPDFVDAILPQSVVVAFQLASPIKAPDELFTIEVPPEDASPTAEFSKTFRTTGQAYFTEAGGNLNEDQTQDLADELARCFYGHQVPLDLAVSGIIEFEPEGITDHFIYTYSASDISTRAVAAPYISGEPEELHHSFGFDPPSASFWGQIIGKNTDKVGWKFREMLPQANGSWIVKPNGLQGSTLAEAWEANAYAPTTSESESGDTPKASSTDYTGQIVRMWRSEVSGEYIFNGGASAAGTPFYNSTEGPIPAYGLIFTTGITTTDGVNYLTGIVPTTDNFYRLVAVNSGSIVEPGDYGTCTTSGFTPFFYASTTPANGDGYGPTPGAPEASKNFPSCLTVYGVIDSESSLAWGYLQPITTIIGRLSGQVNADSLATVLVCSGNAGSETPIYNWTVQAFNRGSLPLADETVITCHWTNGGWYITWTPLSVQIIQGTLTGNLSGSSGTMNECASLTGGPDPEGTLTVANPLTLSGLENDFAWALWNQNLSQWEFLQVQHRTITVIIAHQWTGTAFQYQNQQISVPLASGPSSWLTEVTGVDCPSATD